MENTELRLTPRAVELLEELDDKGLAYEAREDWNQFVGSMGESEAASEIRKLHDELKCELVYDEDTKQERHDACSPEDLPWVTLKELKKAHSMDVVTAPFEEAEARAIAAETETGRMTGQGEGNVKEISGEPLLGASDQAAATELQKANLRDELSRAYSLMERLRGIREATQDAGLSYRNMVMARINNLKALSEETEAFIGDAHAESKKGDLLIERWRSLGRDVHGMETDLASSGDLLQTKDLDFPFPKPREGQFEAARETRDKLLRSDVVACAPTGFGKSAFVLSAVSGFAAGAYVITPQRVLVKQYQSDFEEQVPWVGFYRSRASFKCRCEKAHKRREKNPDPDTWPTCSDMADACGLGAADEGEGTCPYVVERDKALSKPVVVMTAAMATTMMLYQQQRFPKRAVLAVDECQRFEDTLMSACTTTIRYEQLVKDGWTMENDPHGDGEPLLWPTKEVFDESEVRQWLKEWQERAAYRLSRMKPSDLEGAELKEYRRYQGYVQSLGMAFMFDDRDMPQDQRRPHSWVHQEEDERFKQPEAFVVKPLSAVGMLDDIMGESAARKLLVSATPGTPQYIQNTLGLPYTPEYLEYGSPFPIENRPIVYNPVVRLTYKSSKEDYKKLTDMIVKIASDESDDEWTDHKNQKGIIHTVSNKLHKIIVDALRAAGQGWRIREVKGSYRRLEIMDEFMASSEPLIMIGPAITDGVSLKGDQARWGIITKLPWPPPVDPAVAYRKDHIPDWYAFQVVLAVIQGCGRNVRSKDDWAVNYVLDAGFGSLIKRNRHLFPDWFIQAVVKI